MRGRSSFPFKAALAALFAVVLLVAAGCGDDDKKAAMTAPSITSPEELAQKVALICRDNSDAAGKLAKDPGQSERNTIVQELRTDEDQAAGIVSDAKKLPEEGHAELITKTA